MKRSSALQERSFLSFFSFFKWKRESSPGMNTRASAVAEHLYGAARASCQVIDDSLLAATRKRRKEVTIDHLWWHQPSIDRFFSPFLCADSSGQQTNRIAPQALSGWKVNRQGQEIVRSVLLSLSNCFLQGNEREKKYERISCTRLTFSPLMRLVTIHLQDPFSL